MPINFVFGPKCLGVVVVCFVVTRMAWAQPADALPTPLETPQSQASYGIGRQIARDLAQGGLDGDLLDVDALALGIRDALGNTESRITQEQFQAAVGQVQQTAQQRMQQKMKGLADRNRRDGPEFLSKYKALDGVKATESGLLYKVVKQGDGPTPTATDTVKTHYRGRLVDGTEFDSSYKSGNPAVFPVTGVIPGWTEALQMMKVGDRWQIVLPANLAYGPQGSPPVIGPDAVLIFDIELLGIEKGAAPQP